MSHVRSIRWGLPVVSAALVLLAASAAFAVSRPPGNWFAPRSALGGDVSWPASPDVLVGEVVTGGAGASDEYVELYNRGVLAVDLGNLELVYVTANGSTVTRKATWTSRMLEPGHHLLVANSSGVYASLADDVYSGGIAATGGAVAIRAIGAEVIDAIGWGNASNAFVEGTVAPAPPAGQSLERLPGGALGNGRDTNDNLSDTMVQPFPLPEGISAPPVPAPNPTLPAATAPPTDAPTPPVETPSPTTPASPGAPEPTPEPTSEPTLAPTPSRRWRRHPSRRWRRHPSRRWRRHPSRRWRRHPSRRWRRHPSRRWRRHPSRRWRRHRLLLRARPRPHLRR